MKLYFSRFSRAQVLWTVGIIIVVLIAAFTFFGKNTTGNEQTFTVKRGDFVKDVSVSGKVVASENVDLSFAETGRVASLPVKVGDQVLKGQTLASLAVGTLLSDLQAARANLAQKRAENSNTADNLEKVQKEQDTLVASAYAKLLSNDLAAVPNSSNLSIDQPIITGLYNGTEGRYKIIVRRNNASSDDYELSVFELENVRDIEVLNDEPTPLGNKGLFISFPDNLSAYKDTVWYVTIPNTKSATYLSVYNQYQEALRTRDREIANAGAVVTQNNLGLTVSEAEIQSAEAEVARVQAEIAERTIFAPFSGIITTVNSKIGSIASANEVAISLISADTLQIESYVPEIHIPFIKVGDQAVITLDAYGSEVPFAARVISIDPAETMRDGVSTYRAKLEFAQKDDRIKSGMTANVVISSEKKTDVISIPQGAVTNRDGKKIVMVRENEKAELSERVVTTGGISSFGEVEILSGLAEGDVVVISPQEK